MADFARVTVELAYPDGHSERYSFTADEFVQRVDKDDVRTVEFPRVDDWTSEK